MASCDENGYIRITDVTAEPGNLNSSINSTNINNPIQINQRANFNNNAVSSIIDPLYQYCAHDNTIFDFEWAFSDKKFITASGDMKCKIINTYGGKFTNEYSLIGHSKSVKGIKQAFFNENILLSCGRDSVIFVWDLRSKRSNTNALAKHLNYSKNFFFIFWIYFSNFYSKKISVIFIIIIIRIIIN